MSQTKLHKNSKKLSFLPYWRKTTFNLKTLKNERKKLSYFKNKLNNCNKQLNNFKSSYKRL